MDRGPSLSRPTDADTSAQPPASDGTSRAPRSFAPASQAQIRGLSQYNQAPMLTPVRAHQRDSSQIHRLTELTSELLRSLAGQLKPLHKFLPEVNEQGQDGSPTVKRSSICWSVPFTSSSRSDADLKPLGRSTPTYCPITLGSGGFRPGGYVTLTSTDRH